LLARAVAGEAGVPFFATDGAAFAEIYVGTGPKRIRELFAEARKVAPSIIFIDEVDAIAKKRSSSANHSESERESTLISLLSEMDGFRDSKVIVLAATNRADVLDEALTRPGRLDRRIEVPLPDRRGREKILAVHFGERPINSDVDVEALARRTSGMSGADLAQVVNEACIEAARATQTTVSVQNFDQAVATVAMGRARISALVTEADRKLTAWHEAGHTICAYVQDAADKPVSVSIIPRGPAGGVTWMSEGDELFMQRSKASARLVTALGGRAAEELLLGDDYTQGAYGDLTTATNLAFSMATRYGMTSLGLMVRDSSILGSAANEGVADVVEDLLTGALDGARAILAEHRDFMEALVAALLDNDTLVASEITKIYESVGCPGARSPKAILNSRGRQAAPAPTASQPPVSHTPTPPVRELAPAGLIERVALYTNALANVHRHHRKSTKRSSPETTM
jgi:cell division protease FtsH